jgi:cellulose synthase/poly-beta-1,6-N-acetylglucosamine synthase-like glycosyltransferase
MIINTILFFVGTVLMVPVLFFTVQIFAAVFLHKPSVAISKLGARPKIVVLIPAHNESIVISETIKSILPQLAALDRLVVVADNCIDDTALIAKKLGAVIERTSSSNRGKGFALDFGLQYIKNIPADVVIMIDADCCASEKSIENLAYSCVIHQRPVQCLNLMYANANPKLKAIVAQFAWLVKNKVRPLGLKALGMPCQLMGTGMAFLWDDIVYSKLANGHIVEDMKLGIDFARIRKAPIFLEEALVTSAFPVTVEATSSQRTRWEHGHLSVILNEVPRLLFDAVRTKNIMLFALACDLLIPPLAVLVFLCVAYFILSLLLLNQPAINIALILITVLLGSVLMAWAWFGRNVISFKQLCYAPIYALMKIPLYIRFFISRQVEWVRSKRD